LNSQNESSHVEKSLKRLQKPCPKNLLKVCVTLVWGILHEKNISPISFTAIAVSLSS
jgi:hypothetical protein